MTTPEPADPVARRAARDRRATAYVDALVVGVLLAVVLAFAPAVARTTFWVEHFPSTSALFPFLVAGPLFLLGALAPALRPLAWESESAARALRGLAWAVLLYHAFAVLLAAPRLAAILLVPVLAGLPFALLRLARAAAPLGRLAVMRLAASFVVALAAALALAVVAWFRPGPLALAVVAVPVAALFVAAAWMGPAAARRAADPARRPTGPHPLDLPAGMLHPPAGVFPVIVALVALGLILFIVAPGVPLAVPTAWVALVVTVPIIVRAVLRRAGVAHPRGLAGPPGMRRHEVRLEIFSDDALEELDVAVARFLRWGSGRRVLASRLSRLLIAADPAATPEALAQRLGRLPRFPWARGARAAGLVTILGEATR